MNSVIRLCPRCRMASYVCTMTWNLCCPHCSFDIASWLERRNFLRHKIRKPILILNQSRIIEGHTLEQSENGFRISYEGNPVTPGEEIPVEISDMDFMGTARVIWTQTIEDVTVFAGLEIID